MEGWSLEAALVEHCAPTLAGIKPANLFRVQGADLDEIRTAVRSWARELAPYGLSLQILKICSGEGACLIYLYRIGWIHRILAQPAVRSFLEQMGYRSDKGGCAMLEQLSQRLDREEAFPHEIGVFLGYPLEDVVGFIENQGRNFTCCGCWKAYGDPKTAQRIFASYRCCTELWKERYRRGSKIMQLIAA